MKSPYCLLLFLGLSIIITCCFLYFGNFIHPMLAVLCGTVVSGFIVALYDGIMNAIKDEADKKLRKNDEAPEIDCGDDDSDMPDEDFELEIKTAIMCILTEGEHRNKCILLRECEALAKKLPGYNLSDNVVFKSWYKNWKEVIYEDPVLYAAHINNGNAPKEKDPYYDVNVKYDWSVFSLGEDFSDLYENDDEVDMFGNEKPLTREDLEDILDEKLDELAERNNRGSLGRAASNGLALGIGIGLGNALTGGHGIGSSN